MNHLDCFSGIGSWALAAKWMGWNTLAFVEKEPFCQQVLKKNFNGVPIHDDIFTFSALPFRGRVDILTGSTPCQPFSQAGKREGSNDARHLFPEFLRVVAECQPEWVIIENVYGLLNIEGGQVFEAYNTSLESEGYSVQTLCIPASALNAPHRRDRLWIVAHSNSIRERTGCGEIQEANGEVSQWDDDAKSRNSDSELRCLALNFDRDRAMGEGRNRYDSDIQWDSQTQIQERQNEQFRIKFADREDTDAADTRCEYGERRKVLRQHEESNRSRDAFESERPTQRDGQGAVADTEHDGGLWEQRHNASAHREYGDIDSPNSNPNRERLERGIRARLSAEHNRGQGKQWDENWVEVATEFCRVDDGGSVDLDGFKLTASKHRENRLKALGNGIIPQIAYEIFKAIDSSHKAQ